MKKSLFFAVAATVLAGCASDELVDVTLPSNGPGNPDIRFTMSQKNMTRSYTDLHKAGHYNFGVFAYKSTDKENNVMANYLVGYSDETNSKGYKFGPAQTTQGDAAGQVDGKSMWQYEGLGNTEYLYAGGDGFYKASETEYMSNEPVQYLRYWDNAAPATYFYAYAPYINGAEGVTASYVDGTAVGTSADTYVLTIPNGTLQDATVEDGEDYSLSEYMYASAKVTNANYGHDVSLQFHRLNAKVNIKFWEDIAGYSVRILDLSSSHKGVQAAASIDERTTATPPNHYGYRAGKYFTKNGVKIQFADGVKDGIKQYAGTTADNNTPIVFTAPTALAIGTNRFEAAASPTTYFAIPKGQGQNLLSAGDNYSATGAAEDTDIAKTGFTFHVSYELTSTTGERIQVNNATVHVPADYCNWKENTHYTYIFKITKDSNGSTEDPGSITIDPTDPEVPTEMGLYPIIFDNCTVVDWEENESEWNITDGTSLNYHDVQLFADAAHTTPLYSLVTGDLYVNVTDKDNWAGHAINLANITITPADSKITYDGAGKITVATGAAAGVYTVTYTCDAPAGVQANHPTTWTEKFVVGNVYAVALNQSTVGTNGLADTKLTVSPTMDGTATEPTATQLYIEYPDNFSAEQKAGVSVVVTPAAGTDPYKAEVVVKQNALPGVYKIVYTVDEGSVVKVDEKKFTVEDYSFALSENVVLLGASPVVVKAIVPVAAGVISMEDATGITVDDAAKTISVANTASEGTYTVTYTVDGSSVSKVQYKQTFTVSNTYTVALSKNTLKTTQDAANAAEYGSDYITITSTKNGVADALSTELAAKYTIPALAVADYTIAYMAAVDAVLYVDTDPEVIAGTANAGDVKTPAQPACIKLQVKKSVAAGNYTVVYTGQAGKTAEASFIIQK